MIEDVIVPEATGTLLVRAKATSGASPIEMHLYRCVTGHCFAYDHAFPAAAEQMIRVKRPDQGRWVVAVNAAPALVGTGGFTIETLLTARSERHVLSATRVQRWTGTVARPAAVRAEDSGDDVVLLELIDIALEEAEKAQPMASPQDLARLQNRPVAIGSTIVKVR